MRWCVRRMSSLSHGRPVANRRPRHKRRTSMHRFLMTAGLAVAALVLGSAAAHAQIYTVYSPPPVVVAPSPVVSYYCPPTTVLYPPPVTAYYAPAVSYYPPVASYYSPV